MTLRSLGALAGLLLLAAATPSQAQLAKLAPYLLFPKVSGIAVVGNPQSIPPYIGVTCVWLRDGVTTVSTSCNPYTAVTGDGSHTLSVRILTPTVSIAPASGGGGMTGLDFSQPANSGYLAIIR